MPEAPVLAVAVDRLHARLVNLGGTARDRAITAYASGASDL